MTETDAATDRASLVPGAHRLIRAIDGKEGPFTGTLITYGDAVAVCVDVERLSEWSGWAFSDADHVCGVVDIRRRADGHDALLPWCAQRVETFLGRRSASQSSLTPGELGTLVASLLRGVRELGTDADALGDWWLTGDGRPLFVHGEGGRARALTASLVDRLTRQQSDRGTVRILEEMAAALRQPRHPADDDRRWEEQLFARAAPRALQLDVFAPERVTDVAPRLVAADVASHDVDSGQQRRRDEHRKPGTQTRQRERQKEDARRPLPSRRATSRSGRRRGADERIGSGGAAFRWGHRLSAVAEGARQRAVRVLSRVAMRKDASVLRDKAQTRRPKMSRGRSLVLAGSLGAAVLVVGMLWPSDSGDEPAEAVSQKVLVSDSSIDGAATDGAEPPAPMPTPHKRSAAPKEGGAALDAVPPLLDAIAACVAAASGDCPDAVADGANTPSDGTVSQGASGSTPTLVDDYGDVAVIRLTPTEPDGAEREGTEQMMVLERRNDIWLVRDVYDVAHQPD